MTAASAASTQEGVKESVSPWPNWFRSTLSAGVGAAIVFAGVLTYMDSVKAAATAALTSTADHEMRIRTLEQRNADDRALLRSVVEKVDEMRVDVKALLQRTPQK